MNQRRHRDETRKVVGAFFDVCRAERSRSPQSWIWFADVLGDFQKRLYLPLRATVNTQVNVTMPNPFDPPQPPIKRGEKSRNMSGFPFFEGGRGVECSVLMFLRLVSTPLALREASHGAQSMLFSESSWLSGVEASSKLFTRNHLSKILESAIATPSFSTSGATQSAKALTGSGALPIATPMPAY